MSHATFGTQPTLAQRLGVDVVGRGEFLDRYPGGSGQNDEPGGVLSNTAVTLHPLDKIVEPVRVDVVVGRVAAGLEVGVVADEHDRFCPVPDCRAQYPSPGVGVDPEAGRCPRRFRGAPGKHIDRGGDNPGGAFFDIPAPNPIDEALDPGEHHLERYASGRGIVLGSLEESGEDLIPLGPARRVAALSG
jgi:hypothetical protein